MGLVLIVSARSDWSTERVAEALGARGFAYWWLDPADFPQRLSLVARFDGGWHTRLVNSGQSVDLAEVTSVLYWRPADFAMPAGMSGPIVAEAGTHTTVWTRRLTRADLADLAGVETTAHMVQEFVVKSHDVRVTAVGGRRFAVAITAGSEASRVDWRADYDALSYRVVDCPPQVTAGIGAYLAATGLTYGAFDFAVPR